MAYDNDRFLINRNAYNFNEAVIVISHWPWSKNKIQQ